MGNITNSYETLKSLYQISPSFHLVRGEYDNEEVLLQQLSLLQKKEVRSVPLYKIVTVNNIRIGFTNGHQVVPRNDPLSLLTLSREWDVDVLVWGGTHKAEAFEMEGKLFVNPGSITGAPSYDWPDFELEEGEQQESEQNGLGSESVRTNISESDAKNDLTKEDEANITSYNEGMTKEEQEESETARKSVTSKKETFGADEKEEHESAGNSITSAKEAVTASEADKDQAIVDNGNKKKDATEIPEGDSEEKTKIKEIFDKVKELTCYIPSFCLLDIHDFSCTLYIYTYLNDEVKVDTVRYKKK